MVGVVLSGGQSSRMGTDKGLIRLEARNWAQTACEKLTALDLPVMVSVNAGQYETYASIFSVDRLIQDDDGLHLKGPLLGVLSAHQRFPQDDLFVLACDMPLVEQSVLQQLYQAWQVLSEEGADAPAKDACLYVNRNQPEPLCAIYSARGLAFIVQLYQAQRLQKFSMKHMLEQLDAQYIPLQPTQERSFRNFNAHAELNGL